MNGWMDGWMDGWVGGCMDGWMDGFTITHLYVFLSAIMKNRFCVIARYSTETQLFNIETPMPDTLEHDFIEL